MVSFAIDGNWYNSYRGPLHSETAVLPATLIAIAILLGHCDYVGFLQAVLDFLGMVNVAEAKSGGGGGIQTRVLYLEVVISLTNTIEKKKTFTHMKFVPGRGFGKESERLQSPLHVNSLMCGIPCSCSRSGSIRGRIRGGHRR